MDGDLPSLRGLQGDREGQGAETMNEQVVIQTFDCSIQEIHADHVCIVMADETDPSRPDEYAEMLLKTIPAEHLHLGTRFKLKSVLEFYAPKWTAEEIASIETRTKELESLFAMKES